MAADLHTNVDIWSDENAFIFTPFRAQRVRSKCSESPCQIHPVWHTDHWPCWNLVESKYYPDNKVHDAYMGPTLGRQDRGGLHVGPMNLAIWVRDLWQTRYDVYSEQF